MGLHVTFVSGPRRSGKSTVIQAMLEQIFQKKEPHYLRLAAISGDKQPPPPDRKPTAKPGVTSARWLNYDQDLIFEVLPDALTQIHKADRYGSVIIEADADPHLRHAYPYDKRIFVMPHPQMLTQVFRTATQAAHALQEVLDDTATFAREIYGMMDGGQAADEDHESRPAFTIAQMRGFLNSPLGEELATRIQFQPDYHGLVESDIVLINAGMCPRTPVVEDCVLRIEKLLSRLRDRKPHKDTLFHCDPLDGRDATRKRLFKVLKELLLEPKRV